MGSLSHVCPNNKLGLLAHRGKTYRATIHVKYQGTANGKHRAKPASLAVDPKCLTTAHSVNIPLTTSSRNGEILSWTLKRAGEWEEPFLPLHPPPGNTWSFSLPRSPWQKPSRPHLNQALPGVESRPVSNSPLSYLTKNVHRKLPHPRKTNTHTDSSWKTELKRTINRNSRWPIFTSISPLPSFSFESKRNCKGHSFFQ